MAHFILAKVEIM